MRTLTVHYKRPSSVLNLVLPPLRSVSPIPCPRETRATDCRLGS